MKDERVLYETHMHTPLCRHAMGEPSEYAAVALDRGLKGIIVTCHNPIPNGYSASVRMRESEFEEYVALVDRTRRDWEGTLDVRLGLETDFVPGTEDYIRELHKRGPFHHILGSVHPQIPEYREMYFHGDMKEYQRTYFTHLAEAAETGLFDTLSHPDLIKNIQPLTYDLEELMPHICECLDRIASVGTAMELNTSGLYKTVQEMNPSPAILAEILERDIPVVIGADAHEPRRAGDQFVEALELLATIGFTETNIFLERIRHPIAIEDALASLRSPTAS